MLFINLYIFSIQTSAIYLPTNKVSIFDIIQSQQMLPHSNDKKNLIQSMKKLAYYISNDPQRQQQIFNSLSANDLNKIINNLQDENQYLRRVSALLLCELLYHNNQLKIKFCDKLHIPITDHHCRITIGMNTHSLANNKPSILECYRLMKTQPKQGSEEMFCWAIHLDKRNMALNYFQYKKYSSFTFLDPATTIFGTIVINNQYITPQKPSPMKSSDIIQQKKQVIVTEHKRPNSSYDKKLLNTSYKQKSINHMKYKEPIKAQISNEKKSVNSRQKYGNSIYSISQYARNSLKNQKNNQKTRQSTSFHEDFQSKQMNTSRESYNPKTNIVQLRSSFYEGQEGRRNPKNHDSFYKKVQQILRK